MKILERGLLLAMVSTFLGAGSAHLAQSPSRESEEFDRWFADVGAAIAIQSHLESIGSAWWICARGLDFDSVERKIVVGKHPFSRRLGLEEFRDLAEDLGPRCVRELSSAIGDSEQQFEIWVDDALSYRHLLVRSPGLDGVFEGSEYALDREANVVAGADLVWANGHKIGRIVSNVDRAP